jgi:small subunit ribosomal protein S1
LLPKSAISRSADAAQIDKLKPGDTIVVAIENINAGDRKISLIPRDAGDEDGWKEFKNDETDSSSMGVLGEQLAKALNKKDE